MSFISTLYILIECTMYGEITYNFKNLNTILDTYSNCKIIHMIQSRCLFEEHTSDTYMKSRNSSNFNYLR